MNAPVTFQPVPERLRLRVEDFILLNDAGAFEAHAKSELIDGEIYVMNSQWSRHAWIKTELAVELRGALRQLRPDLRLMVEVSIRASDHDMPEPDITVTTWRGARDVPAETVALVVEVSDSTLSTDLGRKLSIYARARLPDYWVVDVEEGRIIRHHEPVDDDYRQRSVVAFGEPLAAATIADLIVDTTVLLD